ncbi:MAG TPA: hypothetical protein VKA67_04975, partial [Verrucomicrobiae bacterium]|nr:hypothetical protein [Verrucomicrobiae bacterium]
LSYGSYSGNFTGFNLPGAVDWQRIYGATSFALVVREEFTAVPLGSNVAFNVSSDPGRQFVLLTSTNVAQPLAQWTPLLTNNLDASGYFSVTNAVDLNIPREFFILKFP